MLAHRHATVDADRLTGNEPRFVAGEVRHARGDVVARTQPLHSHQRRHVILYLLRQAGSHVGLDEARRNRVAGDVLAAQFAGDRLREPEQAGLGRGVIGLAGVAHHAAGAADIHNAAELVFHHRPRTGPNRHKGRLEIGIKHRIPILVAHSESKTVFRDARVVDQDVEPPVVGRGLLDRGGGSRGLRDIKRDDRRCASGRLDRSLQIVQRPL